VNQHRTEDDCQNDPRACQDDRLIHSRLLSSVTSREVTFDCLEGTCKLLRNKPAI
jgi:hypothetical protein